MGYRPIDHPFLNRLRGQVLYALGPIGSTLLSYNLGPDDFVAFKGTAEEEAHLDCPEWLNVSSPEILKRLWREFYDSGVDAVDACCFGANEIVLAEFGLAERTRELNRIAAKLVGEVRDEYSTTDWPRYSFGTIGPGTKLPSLGHTTWDELAHSYREQALGLIEGGIDVLKVETCQDLLQTKAALAAISDVFAETGTRLPVIASVTIETTGTMLLGSDIACALTVLDALDVVDIVGLNCATGPEQMVEHVRYLAEHSRRPVFVGPNAGLPELVDGQAAYKLTPAEFARYQKIFVEEFGTNLVSGCCGTTPAMIVAAVAAIGRKAPKDRAALHDTVGESGSAASLYTSVPFAQDTSFLVVGERMNATGSRAFRDLLLEHDLDGIVALAKEQTGEGAHVLDVMVDYVGRNGVPDMQEVTAALRTQSTLPLMFDSTEPPVVETALKLYGGKALVNSINLEDGERKITRVLALIKRHGAAAVALTIDEEGQARTCEWKVRVAKRIYDIAVNRFGMEPGDLLFDCLTFPLSGGQEDLRGDAMETLNAIRAIKTELPGVHTILGVSNCSFGLKPTLRKVLNSVFLNEAIGYGLDAAIVNAKQIVPLNRIPEAQLQAALDLIYDRRRPADENGEGGYDPLTHFMSLFEGVENEKMAKADRTLLPVEERLTRRIVDGDRRGIDVDLDEALREHDALTIINSYLLDGMREVGELFGSGKMQLPFVLQSAETMKTAVAHLEPHMEKLDGGGKGTIVLATVRGDVHDIGKNLVDIILTNNGYTVHNIGIKQPISQVIDKANEVKADAIGLSGLLVKSTVVMREDLEELNARELFGYPVLLGGAALTRKYVEQNLRDIYKGSVFYCQDAFEGLATLDTVMRAIKAGEPIPVLTRGGQVVEASEDTGYDTVRVATPPVGAADDTADQEYVASEVRLGATQPVPTPPFWGSRVVRGVPLREVFSYINEVALFRGQWQYQKGQRSEAEYSSLTEEEIRPVFRRWQERAIAEQLLSPQVVYGYFPCLADKNDLVVWPGFEAGAVTGEPVRFRFPRQPSGKRLCIADFFRAAPNEGESPEYDVLAMSIVTMGPRPTEFAQELFAVDDYKEYLHFHGFAVESAEALAEYWHRRIRQELGIAGNDSASIRELFSQHYQGSRYAFGYPACPDLEEQVGMATLLEPGRIGVELGETFQWHPEQTTSAIVAHHPAARYFVIR